MLEAKAAENAKRQKAMQERQKEERLKMMEQDIAIEKAKMAAYEEELRVSKDSLLLDLFYVNIHIHIINFFFCKTSSCRYEMGV